jgi:hypothetical protein
MKKILLFLLLILFALQVRGQDILRANPYRHAILSSGTPTTLTTGLIEAWDFDEASGNVIGLVNAYDGTVTSATQNVAGKIGKCVSFDGVNDLITTASIPFGTVHYGSFSCWVNLNHHDDDGVMMSTLYGLYQLKSGVITDDGVWHQLVITYDATLGSANIKMYVDGVFKVSGNQSTDNVSPNVWYFGAADGSSLWYHGLIDMPRIWDKTLTQVEITELYTKENGSTSYPW